LAPTLGEYAVGDSGSMIVPKGDLFFPDGLDLPVRLLAIDVQISDEGQEKVEILCRSVQEII
jgi:hypothetical protein